MRNRERYNAGMVITINFIIIFITRKLIVPTGDIYFTENEIMIFQPTATGTVVQHLYFILIHISNWRCLQIKIQED
jgi:hypothetical protein